MRDYFSPGCERAIETARLMASGDAVDAVHLALGLLHDPEGAAFALASRCGADIPSWSHRQTARLRDTPVEPMTLPAERAIRQARSFAREFLVDRTVTSELLLVAVVESDVALATELADIGLDLKKLRQLVIDPLTTPIPLADSTDVARPPAKPSNRSSGSELERILDAAGNRAREALRVLEDYARFGRDDAALTNDLKSIRHELNSTLDQLPRSPLLTARNTLGDVGTAIATSQEYQRGSLAEVVTANVRRLQEALRSLEEFGKVQSPALGRQFEALRYRIYTLEKRLIAGDMSDSRLADARLYLLMPATSLRRPWQNVAQSAIAGGVQVVQLRDKMLTDQELLPIAREMRQITRATNTLFFVNDRVDLALACDADGVHLGQDDLPIDAARQIVGNKLLIGVSTHNVEQLHRAVAAGVDYVGIGPTFASTTKTFDALAGLDFVRQATDCPIPAFVLGGITLDNLEAVLAAGGRRVAVSGAILNSDDPESAARQLRNQLDAAKTS